MDPAVSVIYVNYNTSRLLLQSISSLLSQCRSIAYELIIIDNASRTDEQVLLQTGLDQIQLENCQLILSEINAGFAKANNRGAENARGKYLLFLNPDTLILNDAISIFFNFLESSDPKIAACGGNLLTENHTPNYSYGNFPGLLYEICSIGFGLRYLFPSYYKRRVFIGRTVEGTGMKKAPYITGADIFIRKDCFRAMNGFDEQFFMYYEETDLFMRLKRQNYQAFVLPEARIVHFEGGAIGKTSARAFNYNKFELTLKSKLYYFSKWFPPYILHVLKVVVFLQILVQFVKGNHGNQLKKSLSIYWNSI